MEVPDTETDTEAEVCDGPPWPPRSATRDRDKGNLVKRTLNCFYLFS